MFDFHEKRKIRRILYSKISILVVFLFAVLLSTAVYERYTVSKAIKEKLDERQAELYILEQRAEVIESKVEYLKDERGVEEELRNRFDVAKEGEQVVVLLDRDDERKTSRQVDNSETEEEKGGFFKKLFFWR